MRVVVDASILVGELLRARGQRFVANPNLETYVAERALDEAQHELKRRTDASVRHGHVSQDIASALLSAAWATIDAYVIVVPEEVCATVQQKARSRIPRDQDDWQTVAIALLLEAGIWTRDNDFLGCGCPTWITETLSAEVGE